jgi:hypothetical protein
LCLQTASDTRCLSFRVYESGVTSAREVPWDELAKERAPFTAAYLKVLILPIACGWLYLLHRSVVKGYLFSPLRLHDDHRTPEQNRWWSIVSKIPGHAKMDLDGGLMET